MSEIVTSWHSYPSVFALGHAAIVELLNGDVHCEEKVDGSQFSFGIFDGQYRCRSKGKQIDLDAPEKMFLPALEATRALPLHDGWTYRGECLTKPKHNSLTYARVPKHFVILFDINTAEEQYLSYDEKVREAERIGMEIVPRFPSDAPRNLDELKKLLETESCLGGPKIEGVVIKNYGRFGRDKKVLMGKFVSEAFKETHAREWKNENLGVNGYVMALCHELRTEARWQKALQHLRDAGELENMPRDIPKILAEVGRDTKQECEADIKERLFKQAWKEISRSLCKGLPEWYKQRLAEQQFSEQPPAAEEV